MSDDENVKIILPDFSYEDVKKFLDTIYLNNSADGCLLQQYLNKIDHAHSRQIVCDPHDYVKHEEKVKKLPVEIKMEASTEIQEATKKFQLDDLELISLDDDNNSSAKKTSFECSQCGKVFKKRRILRSHMNIHKEPKYFCDFEGCDKKFRLKANLKAHQDVVHLKCKPINCDKCDKQFYNQSQLRSHMEHHDSDKHVCEHCSNSFSCSKTLKEHIKFKHSDSETRPVCTVCHKVFSTPQNLKSHFSRVHMQEKKFVCPECGKSFFEKAQLEAHLSSHNVRENEYQCDVCKLKFKSKKTLYYHKKRTHNPDNKIHICYQCGKSYADSHHLNRHLDTHGQKSSFCKTCGKAFQSEEKVKAHVRKVHEKWRRQNDVPIMCALCDKYLSNFTSMKRHLKEVHKLSNYESNSILIEKFKLDPQKHKINPAEIIPELLMST